MCKFFCVFLLAIALTHCQSDVLFEDAYCLQNITLIDPIRGQVDDQTVVIKEGKIFLVEQSAHLRLDGNNKVVDGSDLYLIPGLWDAHVHFAFIEELAPRMLDLFLAHGITGVRDIGGNIHFVKRWKDLALANQYDAPRVKIAGPLLDGMPNVYDGSGPFTPALSVGLQDVSAVEAMVDSLVHLGVDLLKAYEMLTPEQFARIAQLARKHGMRVTGHVPLSMDVRQASDLGLNSMEHMRNLELSCAANADQLLQQRKKLLIEGQRDPGTVLRSRIHDAQRQVAVDHFSEAQTHQVLSTLASNDTWQIPTLALSTATRFRPFLKQHFKNSFRYLGDAIEANWVENSAAFGEQDISPWQRQYAEWLLDMIPRFKEYGITIMAGTDCPIFFLTPGLSLHEELRILNEAGLTALEAITAATLTPAAYFGLENELGSIEEGKWADLVVLRSNPLEDINNTRDIEAVIRLGKLHTREMLDQLLQKLDQNE